MDDTASCRRIDSLSIARRRPGFAWVWVGVLVLSLSGCTSLRQWCDNGFKVGPNYLKPAAPVESQWIDYQHDARVSEAPVDISHWWHVFNDPILNGLVEFAAQQNVTLRVAGARILQAQAVRGITAGNLFPQVQQAFGGYDRVQVSRSIANSPPVRNYDVWSNGFNLSWEIDFWGRYRRALESADAALDATVEGYDNVLVLLVSDVAATYVQIRTLQEEIRLAEENIELQKKSLSIASAQFDSGQTDASDVLQTRNNVEQTESVIPQLEAALRQANNALCVLLGEPPRDLIAELGEGPIPTAPANVVLGIPADLLRRRPDIRQAERLVAAQCAQIGVAEADLYPQFGINGILQWQADDISELFASPSVGGSIGPSFVWNILNYGRIANSIEQQQAIFEETVYSYQNTVLNAQQEVEDAIVGFLKAQDQTAKLELAVNDITQLTSILLTQSESGATNFDRVYVVQVQATVQQDSLATSTGNIALNLIGIYRALGGGWQVRLQQTPRAIAPIALDAVEPPLVEEVDSVPPQEALPPQGVISTQEAVSTPQFELDAQ